MIGQSASREFPATLRDAVQVTNVDGPDVPRRSHRDRPTDDEQRMPRNFNPNVVV